MIQQRKTEVEFEHCPKSHEAPERKKKQEFETQKKSAPTMNPKICGADFMNWVRQKAGGT